MGPLFNFYPRLQSAEEDFWNNVPPGTTIVTPTDDSTPKYSTSQAYQYNLIKEYLQDTYEVTATVAGAFANDFADQWYQKHGSLPQAYQLMTDSGFNSAASRLVTGADFLPPYFETNGTFFVNTPDVGPVPIPGFDPEMSFLERKQGLSALGISFDELNRAGNFVPRLGMDQVLSILNLRAPATSGGGGGGGYRAPVFDEATLSESMKDMWRFYLIDEMDQGKLSTWISDYVKQAGSFARQGGQLGLEAWFKERMRNESRYKYLYQHKPGEVDEDQWVGRYQQLALGAGLRDQSVQTQTERGASQGIGLGGFQTQINKSPEVRAQGGFSQNLAKTVSGLGAMART